MSQARAKTPFKLGAIGKVIKLQSCKCTGFVQALHADIVGAAAGNHGEGSFAGEMFKRGVFGWTLDGDPGYQRMLTIVVTIGFDAAGGAHGRTVAIGPDHQCRLYCAALDTVLQLNLDMFGTDLMVDVVC